MYCTKCGKQNQEGAIFCAFCGNRIQESPAMEEKPEEITSDSVRNIADSGVVRPQPVSAGDISAADAPDRYENDVVTGMEGEIAENPRSYAWENNTDLSNGVTEGPQGNFRPDEGPGVYEPDRMDRTYFPDGNAGNNGPDSMQRMYMAEENVNDYNTDPMPKRYYRNAEPDGYNDTLEDDGYATPELSPGKAEEIMDDGNAGRMRESRDPAGRVNAARSRSRRPETGRSASADNRSERNSAGGYNGNGGYGNTGYDEYEGMEQGEWGEQPDSMQDATMYESDPFLDLIKEQPARKKTEETVSRHAPQQDRRTSARKTASARKVRTEAAEGEDPGVRQTMDRNTPSTPRRPANWEKSGMNIPEKQRRKSASSMEDSDIDIDDYEDMEANDPYQKEEQILVRKIWLVAGIMIALLIAAVIFWLCLMPAGQKFCIRMNWGAPASAYASLAVEYEESGRSIDAAKYYYDALRLDPNNYNYALAVARSQLNIGEKETAEKAYAKCIDLQPNQPEPYIELAAMYEQDGDTDRQLVTLQTGYDKTGNRQLFEQFRELKAALEEKEEASEEEGEETDEETDEDLDESPEDEALMDDIWQKE